MESQKSSRFNRDKTQICRKNLEPSPYNLEPSPYNLEPNFGFTIIELLVSIAVIFLLMGFVFTNYARLSQRQVLISSGHTLRNILRDAQSRAYTGEMDCSLCDCSINAPRSLIGWYADFSAKEIYGECKTGLLGDLLGDPTITFSKKPFALPSEINITPYITPPTIPEKILFSHYPLGVDRSATICLSSSSLPADFYKIQVTQAGEISDTGKLSTCP